MATSPREAYQLPSQRDASSQVQQQPPSSSVTGYRPSYGDVSDGADAAVTYECGECACKVALNIGDAIRCKECGHRVLYKQRTTRMVQFEAR